MNEHFQIEPVFESFWTRTIVFAPDNNFVKYFGVALQSLIENSKNYEDYDIIVLESDISVKNKKLLLNMLPPNFNLRFFDINKLIKEKFKNCRFKTTSIWSMSTYYRLFIPLIMQKYERVLYCDVDLVFTGSLQELFQTDFEDYELLAVLDPISPILSECKWLETHFIKELKLKEPEKYFNAGVLMFNIPQIDIEAYYLKLSEILTGTKLVYLDQDVLNVLFQSKTKLISVKWNYQWGIILSHSDYESKIHGDYKNDFISAKEKPVMVHYTTSRKPWALPEVEHSYDFWNYARRSPFYEEILYTNLKVAAVNEETIKNINLKWKIYYDYYRAKLLSFVTFGKRKSHYIEKRDRFKQRVRDIRKFSSL